MKKIVGIKQVGEVIFLFSLEDMPTHRIAAIQFDGTFSFYPQYALSADEWLYYLEGDFLEGVLPVQSSDLSEAIEYIEKATGTEWS